MKKTFEIEGMTCSACEASVDKAISQVDGVKDVSVNLLLNQATVEMDDNLSADDIVLAINNSGYKASEKSDLKEVQLDVDGMTCAMCSTAVEKAINNAPGVSVGQVNLLTNSAAITFDPAVIKTQEIIEAIEKVGYGAKVHQSFKAHDEDERKQKDFLDSS